MEKILKTLFILGVVIATLLSVNLNPPTASAQSIQDCASQEGCLAILQDTQIKVYRKGLLKGTVDTTWSNGVISASQGWIIATQSSGMTVRLYEILTDTLCSAEIMCQDATEGEIFIHPTDPELSRALIVCPGMDNFHFVKLDCSLTYSEDTGDMPESITRYGEYSYLISHLSMASRRLNGRSMYPSQTSWSNQFMEPEGFNMRKARYWNNGTDPAKIFVNAGNKIFWQDTHPIPDGADDWPVFYTLPTGIQAGSMTVNQTHVLASPLNGYGVYLIEIANPTSHTLLDARTPYYPAGTPSYAVLSSDKAFIRDTSNTIKVFGLDGTLLYTISEPAISIAYIGPTLPPACSNNLVEPGETCDGTDFDGLDCTDYGFDAGALTCSPSCDAIFASGCWSCGDGTMNPGEYCDGDDLGEASCAAAGYANGTVSCRVDCTVDYSQCYTCGNGLIEGAEECEGADLQGATCESEGFVGGTLTCTDCMLDTSACHMCGNDFTDEGELCDGTHTPGKICQTMGAGYTSGQLLCASGCATYDTSACNTCGDGVVNSPEECDGENLGEQTCASLGLSSGTLSCFQNCTFNFNGCSGVQTEYCGNGNIDPGEECDDGNRSNSDDCSEFCKIIPPTCGVGGIDAGEECDGEELGDATCESLGYEAGVLYCGGDCRLRTDGCTFVSVPQSIQLTLGGEPESGELNPALKTQYEDLKSTLTYNCISQEVNGDLVITTTEGSYCAVRAHDLDTGDKLFSFIYIPENPLERESPVVRFYQNGTIAQNFGGQINAFQGLQIKIVVVQDRLYNVTQDRISSMGMRFLAVHPETQSRGRWLALNVGVGSTKFCTDESGDTCALFIPKQGELVLNLDNLEDLSEIGWKTPKDPGGCSCTTGTNNNSTSLPLLFSALAMALLFLRRRRNRVR